MFPDEYVQPNEGSESLVGVDSHASSIMAHTSGALKRAGNPSSVVNKYRVDAMFGGDYDHLLALSMAYLDGDEEMLEQIS